MRKTLLLTALLTSMALWAAPPEGYYAGLNGISEPAGLKTAVYQIVNPHTVPSVSDMERYYYNSLPQFFQRTDTYPGSNRWWDMYSDGTFYAPSMSGLNREHSFPKSWWGGNTDIPPFVDLNHLYPAEREANMAKSNYPLGEVNTSEKVSFDNGVSKVGYASNGQGGNAPRVFEPADDYKGDFARTYFYMVTCYQNLTWNSKYSWMLQSNTYPTLKPWAVDLLLRWSHDDPVSQKEIDRNEQVYAIQNNRNPFIDLPGLEQYIWGEKMGQKFTVSTGSGGTTTGQPELFAPVDGMSLDFNQVAVDGTTRSLLLFRGENLKGNVSVLLTGADRKMFGIDERSISASLINSPDGYYLPVYYKPTAIGSHTANLTVFDVDGWASGRSLNVTLRGECVAAPTLKQIKALPASDITAGTYTANWEVPEGDVVDYYIVNRSHYVDGRVVVDELTAEENSLVITGFNAGDYDSYTVQSVRLGFRSVPSNAIVVAEGGIQGVDAGTPLAVEVYDGGIVRFVCASAVDNVTVYDIFGRMVRGLGRVCRNDEVQLPRGIYIITADGTASPVRIIVR